jgi:hypothetical protein
LTILLLCFQMFKFVTFVNNFFNDIFLILSTYMPNHLSYCFLMCSNALVVTDWFIYLFILFISLFGLLRYFHHASFSSLNVDDEPLLTVKLSLNVDDEPLVTVNLSLKVPLWMLSDRDSLAPPEKDVRTISWFPLCRVYSV